jgi:hypothetical protein
MSISLSKYVELGVVVPDDESIGCWDETTSAGHRCWVSACRPDALHAEIEKSHHLLLHGQTYFKILMENSAGFLAFLKDRAYLSLTI